MVLSSISLLLSFAAPSPRLVASLPPHLAGHRAHVAPRMVAGLLTGEKLYRPMSSRLLRLKVSGRPSYSTAATMGLSAVSSCSTFNSAPRRTHQPTARSSLCEATNAAP